VTASGHPVAFETWVAYWAGDLDAQQADVLEEHAMGCAECSAVSAEVAQITEALRTSIAPVIPERELAALRARGLVVEENPLAPGERRTAVFRPGTDILLHRLGGLDLSTASRVDLEIRVEDSNDVLLSLAGVPFEAESGEFSSRASGTSRLSRRTS
jgi:hypothetical protein